jgi:hypothetical protein
MNFIQSHRLLLRKLSFRDKIIYLTADVLVLTLALFIPLVVILKLVNKLLFTKILWVYHIPQINAFFLTGLCFLLILPALNIQQKALPDRLTPNAQRFHDAYSGKISVFKDMSVYIKNNGLTAFLLQDPFEVKKVVLVFLFILGTIYLYNNL